nr:disulfide bond formation protein B [Hydrogenophaga sp.]
MTPAARRGLLALTAVVALAAVGAAVFTQQAWDMQPCPWCVLQRLIFVAIAGAALLGLLWPTGGAVLAG